ncbi:MAG: hypothetical protein AAB019_01860 [Planctomycetota bacterium]
MGWETCGCGGEPTQPKKDVKKVIYECKTCPDDCPPKTISETDPVPECCGELMKKKVGTCGCR